MVADMFKDITVGFNGAGESSYGSCSDAQCEVGERCVWLGRGIVFCMGCR